MTVLLDILWTLAPSFVVLYRPPKPYSTQNTAWRSQRNAKKENHPRSDTASEERDASEVVAARIVTSTGDLHPLLVSHFRAHMFLFVL